MKKILGILLVVFSLAAHSQSFEGMIVYKNAVKSKTKNFTDQQWTEMVGANQQFFIKGGNYKSVTNGSLTQWQLYVHAENKLYSKMGNSEIVLWNDASVNTDEILNARLNKNAVTILGYSCDELILTCKSGVQKYYFSSKLAIDPALFIDHKYGNWYEYLSKAKAVSLKTIIETPQFIMETEATEVVPKKLDDSIFVLEQGTKTAKSPY